MNPTPNRLRMHLLGAVWASQEPELPVPARSALALEIASPRRELSPLLKSLRRDGLVVYSSSSPTGRTTVRLPEEYTVITRSIGLGWVHALVLHPACITPQPTFNGGVFIIGNQPEHARMRLRAGEERRFAVALECAIATPTRPEWAAQLFAAGRTAGLLPKLPSTGRLEGYFIVPRHRRWAELVARIWLEESRRSR